VLFASLSLAASSDNVKKAKQPKETETEAAAVKLFKTGRMVQPAAEATNIAAYLEALAISAGTQAVRNEKNSADWQAPAPKPAGKAPRPVFEWLAETINASPINLEVDSKSRWCFFLRGDRARRVSYAASGGVLCMFDGFYRRKTRDRIWTLSRFIFDRELVRNVVATQMEMEVIAAVNSNGKKLPAKKPGPNAGGSWSTNQQEISLKKADFPGNRIDKLHVRGKIALKTGTTKFLVKTLGHKKPITISQDGVTVIISPIKTAGQPGDETWSLPIEVRTKYDEPRGMIGQGERIAFLSEDGKHLPRSSWSGTQTAGGHKMTVKIKPHSIDPKSTQLAIEHPTGLRILPVDLIFKNVSIRDIPERRKK